MLSIPFLGVDGRRKVGNPEDSVCCAHSSPDRVVGLNDMLLGLRQWNKDRMRDFGVSGVEDLVSDVVGGCS